MRPNLKLFATLQVLVDSPIDLGQTQNGGRRIVPITGGKATGDGWTGKILPVGADFQHIVNDQKLVLEAKYAIETDKGEFIYVKNNAIRVADKEATKRILNDQPVDPKLIYCRCVPSFETSSATFAWIEDRIFIGHVTRYPDYVEIEVYEVE